MLTAAESAKVMAPFAPPDARYEVRARAMTTWRGWSIGSSMRRAGACRQASTASSSHAGHGYLLHLFLSPSSNQRDVTVGAGRSSGRGACCSRTVRAVRAEVGPDVPVWARIGAFEAHRDPGQRLGDALVAMVAGPAPVSTRSTSLRTASRWRRRASPTGTPCTCRRRCSRSRPLPAVSSQVPVIAMGRLTPEAAEQALADEAADVIAMARPLVADPDLPNKPARVVAIASGPAPTSTLHRGDLPERARRVRGQPGRRPRVRARHACRPSRRIVVAGGGPAGLECAAWRRAGIESSPTRPPASWAAC